MAQQVESPEERNPFATDPADELPVGLQLSWRLRALIATGHLAAGERLPSFRRLSEWAGVNVNTVRAVYAGLEREGMVVSRQGQGTFVADGFEPATQLEEIATEALQRAREAGLSPRELAIVASACAGMPGALGGESAGSAGDMPDLAEESEAIEVRHELRRQIARLEAELATFPRDLPLDLPTAPRRAKAHIAGVEELEQTRDTLIAQLSTAQKAAEQRARQAGRERAQRPQGPLEQAMSWWRHKL